MRGLTLHRRIAAILSVSFLLAIVAVVGSAIGTHKKADAAPAGWPTGVIYYADCKAFGGRFETAVADANSCVFPDGTRQPVGIYRDECTSISGKSCQVAGGYVNLYDRTSNAVIPNTNNLPAAGVTTSTQRESKGASGAQFKDRDPAELKNGYGNLNQSPCDRLLNANWANGSGGGNGPGPKTAYYNCYTKWNHEHIHFNGDSTKFRKAVEDLPGRFPTGNYELTFEMGEWDLGLVSMPNPIDYIMGFATTIFWTIATTVVKVGLWLVSWSFSFPLIEELAKWVSKIARAINTAYVFDSVLQLRYLAFFFLMIYAGFLMLRGKIGKAISEILVSCLIFALALVMLVPKDGWFGDGGKGGPGGYLMGGFALVGGLAGDVTELMIANNEVKGGGATCDTGDGHAYWCQGLNYMNDAGFARYLNAKCPNVAELPDVNDALAALKNVRKQHEQLFCRFRAEFHANLVEIPFDQAQYGAPMAGGCAKIRDNALASGGWSSKPWLEAEAMRIDGGKADKGNQLNENGGIFCGSHDLAGISYDGNDVANYNMRPTPERALITLLTMLAAIATIIGLGGMAVVLLGGQITAAALMALAPIALISGIAPGGGRNFFVRWVIMLGKDLVFVVVSSLFLAVLVSILHLFLTQTQDLNIYIKFAVLVFISAFTFKLLKKMYTGVDNSASGFAMKMQGWRAGDGDNNRMYARTDGRPINTQWGGSGGGGYGRGAAAGAVGTFSAARLANAIDPAKPIEAAGKSALTAAHRNTVGNVKAYTTYEGKQRRKGKQVADYNYQETMAAKKAKKKGSGGDSSGGTEPTVPQRRIPQQSPTNNGGNSGGGRNNNF